MKNVLAAVVLAFSLVAISCTGAETPVPQAIPVPPATTTPTVPPAPTATLAPAITPTPDAIVTAQLQSVSIMFLDDQLSPDKLPRTNAQLTLRFFLSANQEVYVHKILQRVTIVPNYELSLKKAELKIDAEPFLPPYRISPGQSVLVEVKALLHTDKPLQPQDVKMSVEEIRWSTNLVGPTIHTQVKNIQYLVAPQPPPNNQAPGDSALR